MVRGRLSPLPLTDVVYILAIRVVFTSEFWFTLSCVFCGELPYAMVILSNNVFERDMVVEKIEGKVDTCVLRGSFLPPFQWVVGNILPLRRVPGSFVNMTSFLVPCTVSGFLSLGPKFMMPSFTLVSSLEKDDGWFTLLWISYVG